MNMDHDHGHGGGEHGGEHGGHGDGGDQQCDMLMHFHAGHCESILWKSWTARTELEFVFSALGIFVLAFLYEALKYIRERYYVSVAQAETMKLITNHNTSNGGPTLACCSSSMPLTQKSMSEKLFNRAHVLQTFMHFLQIIISYLLMLIVMTYNYWLFTAIVLGASLGYFCFGWIRQQAVDSNEHCH